MMQKYVLLARVSNEFASAMLNKPQDRLEIVRPILNALNIEVCEFLFTSDSKFNFVGICDLLFMINYYLNRQNKAL